MAPITLTAFLSSHRFDTAEVANAAGIGIPRLADWLKREVFMPLLPAKPGTGRSREFTLADVYRATLLAALTEQDGLFAMPVGKGGSIVDQALGLLPEFHDGNPELAVETRDCLMRGVLPDALTMRAPQRAAWLVFGIVDRVAPTRGRIMRASFASDEMMGAVLPNPLGAGRALGALEVTPLVAEADRRLAKQRGLAALFPAECGEIPA